MLPDDGVPAVKEPPALHRLAQAAELALGRSYASGVPAVAFREYQPATSRFFQGRAGLVVLLCTFPAVLLGALVLANRYVAQGFVGVDCDGPMHVLVFAVPVLLLCGFGTIANASRRGRSPRPLVALGCALACAVVAVNAVAFLHRNATENAGSCGDQRWPSGHP